MRIFLALPHISAMEILLQTVYSGFMQSAAHPFVKWAGGKTQLLPEIRKHYPQEIKKYCEPFVGGGAVFFDVLQKCQPEEVLVNDVNAELINTYSHIKNSCNLLIEQLSELQQKYKSQTLEKNKILFYEKRLRYNELKLSKNDAENLEKAALFIFLNKTCFNGLYRVNKKGEFNVPFNNAKNPLICDEENQCVPAKAVGLSALRYRSFRRNFQLLWNFGAPIPHAEII